MRARKVLAVLSAVVVATTPNGLRAQQPRVIRVTAERFAFTPSQIVVDAGEAIELRLKSDDTSHGFRIAGTNVNVAIPKRGRSEIVIPLQVAKPGRYAFECTRMCGAGHHFMRGVLVVRDRSVPPTGR